MKERLQKVLEGYQGYLGKKQISKLVAELMAVITVEQKLQKINEQPAANTLNTTVIEGKSSKGQKVFFASPDA